MRILNIAGNRLCFICILALSCTVTVFGQSLDAEIPSARLGSAPPSQVQDPAGAHVVDSSVAANANSTPDIEVKSNDIEVDASAEDLHTYISARNLSAAPLQDRSMSGIVTRTFRRDNTFQRDETENRSLFGGNSTLTDGEVASKAARSGLYSPRSALYRGRNALRGERTGSHAHLTAYSSRSTAADAERFHSEWRNSTRGAKPEGAEPGILRLQQQFQWEAVHTENFPDSTRGTALLSPPDPGTESPLGWSPDLHAGIPEMQQQFLNPTLQVSARSRRKRRGAFGKGGRRQGGAPFSPLRNAPNPDEALRMKDSLEPDALEPGIPSDTGLLSSLDQQPNQ